MTPDTESENRLLKTMVTNYRELCARHERTIRELTGHNTVHRWVAATMAARLAREPRGMASTWKIADFGDETLRDALRAMAAAEHMPQATRVTLVTCQGGAVIRFQS